MKEKSIFTNIAFGILLFILVIAVGFVVWEYSQPYRSGIVDRYVARAEELVGEGDSMAMWELEKAYFIGLDYPAYRQKKALFLVDLHDVRAKEELNWLVDQGWADDRVNFECGKMAFLDGDYDLAWDYFGKMSKDSDPAIQGEALVYMAGMAGREGNWVAVEDYLRQAENKNYKSKLKDKYKFSLYLVLADWEQVGVLKSSITKVNDMDERIKSLQNLAGDVYFIQSSKLLCDIGLPGWARSYLNQVPVDTIAKKDLYKVYAYSYLIDQDCSKSLKYLKLAEEIDPTDSDIHTLLSRTYDCLGLTEWKEWEEGLV